MICVVNVSTYNVVSLKCFHLNSISLSPSFKSYVSAVDNLSGQWTLTELTYCISSDCPQLCNKRACMFLRCRWNIEIRPSRHLGIRRPVRSMFMYNYLSVGVDAQVTLDFHRARESPFYIISSRLINKVRKFTADILCFHELLIACVLGIYLQASDVHQYCLIEHGI